MADPTPKTDQTLARLKAYAKGNGFKDGDIALIDTKEAVFTVSGVVKLTPHCDIKSRRQLGRIKGKAFKVLSSFAELQSEIEALQKDFQEGGNWTNEATDELRKTEGHGWGLHAAQLRWSDKKIVLAATENCSTCRGTAQHPCHDCQGLGFTQCHYCQSRGQEQCPQCGGHGHDISAPQNRCPNCNGTGYSLCRFCQGKMKLQCEICQGRGSKPCMDCKGTGFISQEVHIYKGARLDFSLASTSGLPSGLLRGLSRVGEDKLHVGHADITMKPLPDDPNAPKAQTLAIPLEAKIPYADIKLRLGGKPVMISCFGKQGRLSGVPPFLDDALADARRELGEAVASGGGLNKALRSRAINDAFTLVLAGKNSVGDLRRLYPIGLSPEAANEIMKNLVSYFRKNTARSRLLTSAGFVALSAAVFIGFFMTPIYEGMRMTMAPSAGLALKYIPLPIMLGLLWLTLQTSAKMTLQKKYGQVKIAKNQAIGRTGLAAMGAIILIYLIVLFLSHQLV